MFGFLKKKLSRAIESISKKLEEKEPKEESVEEIEEPKKAEKIEEAIPLPEPEEISHPVEIPKPVVIEKPKAEKPKPEKPSEKKPLLRGILKKVTKRIAERRLAEDDLRPILDDLEIDLIESDVAVNVSEKIKKDLIKELAGKEIRRGKENEAIVEAFKNSLMDILSVEEVDLREMPKRKKPFVMLFLGFNGSGKTTSIAKVANWLKKEGFTCVLAAADTFRAASMEQLEEHADNIGVKVIKHKYGADPAAVVYDAVEHAKAKKLDFVLADTAGRIHTNSDLMKEMEKIIRVNKPDMKVLVIDSLTGNDALMQAQSFGELGIDATIFTKVDVNEKGGAILSVTHKLKKPILFLGVGQAYDEFEKFDKASFVEKIFE